MNKSKIYIALVLAFCSICTYGTEQESGNDNAEVMPLDPGSLRLSGSVKSILSMGIDMPVLLASEDDLFGSDIIVIGSANFYLSDDALIVKSFSLRPNEKGVELSEETRYKLKELKDKKLSDNKEIVIDENSRIVFDLEKMRLTLKVSRSAFGVKELTKSAFLAPASVNDLTGVLNYHLNANHTMGELDNTTSVYLGFNSILAMGENHLLLDGSLYSPQTSGGDSLSLDRVMYERDFEGRRLALGMMDGWALQSLGQVSTLSGTQMYGFSYGNVSSSYKADASQSLTPINVYFPSAGEARVYRDGRLLSAQQKFMGNHELDARSLPGGVYDVQVDVVVAGKVVSTGTFRVNKPVNYGLRNDELNWQVWGGLGRESSAYHSATNESESNRMLAGVSVAGRTWDAAWSASLYFNQGTWVEEATVARTFFETLQINLQNVYASDGMRRTLGTVSLPLFSNLGTVSYSREAGHTGSRLKYMVESRESVTASLNMSALYRPLGNLNLSYDKYGDSDNGNKQFRWTYNQQLYSGKLGVLSVNVGSNFDSTLSNGYAMNSRSRYAMFNLSVPLASDFSVGFSQDEGGRTLDLSAGQGFSEGPVNYVNGSVSKQLGENNRGATYNGYLDFSTSLATGVMSAMGGQGSNSIGLSASGSMGFGGGSFAFGPLANGSAGMVIDIPQDGDDSLAANINGQHYPLTAGSNYVALSPYERYEVEVVHGEDAPSAYEISAQKEQVTLYPGNVHHFVPGVKQMVTVFGRLVLPSGEPVAHAALNNHIGSAYTADDGSFAIDIDRSKPQISVDSPLTGKFAVKIELENQRGAVMVDDIIWTGDEVATKVQ